MKTSKSEFAESAASMSAARRWLLLGAAVLALFSGLCTVFAGVVTAAQATQTHAQASWPAGDGTVDICDIQHSSTRQRTRHYIHCRFHYFSNTGPETATLNSTYFYPPDVPQSPPNQQQPFIDWLNEHTPGAHVVLRYDPANHERVILAEGAMPRSGSHTPDNLRLLAVFAAIFVVTLLLAQVLRPHTITN